MLPDRLRLLFVGINPGLWTAAVNAHFARRGNRFWPALHLAKITPWLVDASAGLATTDVEMLKEAGVGITNLVPTATARADELSAAQLRAGVPALRRVVKSRRPRVVAILGITAYRQAFEQPAARTGPQPGTWAGAELWILSNPSGLNAHASLAQLAAAYRDAAIAAGVPVEARGPDPART